MTDTRKSWTRAALVGVLLLFAGSAAQGQQADKTATAKQDSLTVADKRYDAAKELVRMTKRYGLSEEQQAKIQPLLLEQQRQVHALTADESLNDMQWAAAVRRVHADTIEKIKAELADAQIVKYAKDEDKRAKSDEDDDNGFGPPGGPPFGGGPPPGGPM